eukprot:5285683-Amphidinium_carterae.1
MIALISLLLECLTHLLGSGYCMHLALQRVKAARASCTLFDAVGQSRVFKRTVSQKLNHHPWMARICKQRQCTARSM